MKSTLKGQVLKKAASYFRVMAAALALLLNGCAAVGPDYVRPRAKTPTAWHTQLKDGQANRKTDPRTLAKWWDTLDDPVLSSLINRAVSGNLDIKKATERVLQARAQRGLAGAALFPTLDAKESATRSRSSGSNGFGGRNTFYSTGFDAGWELDFFGGTRRGIEAANADLAAGREDLHDVMVSLLAETALNYVEARTLQARLAVAIKDLRAREETYRLVFFNYQAGLTDELAVHQARYNLETTRSRIPTLKTALAADLNQLSILIGEAPGAIDAEISRQGPIPIAPLSVAVGVPADTLRLRPDVRRAERRLAAQTARIGVAKADLYPRFNLTGSIGLEALSPGDLLTAGSRTWHYGTGISWKIFDANAIRENIDVQSSLQKQALITYESTILGALEEVENAIKAFFDEQNRRASLASAVLAARQAEALAQDKYKAGMTDFNTVLDAQRSLFSLQDQKAGSDGAVTSDLIRLYKALGGGWTTFAAAPNSSDLKKSDANKKEWTR
ncbi:MAG: efflux transporter outer membrane subunit [Deltaproteobacteria bacterium]|nr:efflux transporter outer membrane subunit [Deltaproteobacteria bacterium]